MTQIVLGTTILETEIPDIFVMYACPAFELCCNLWGISGEGGGTGEDIKVAEMARDCNHKKG